MTRQLHLGVALDGYGWDPQAWRATLASNPDTPSALSGRYWAEQAVTAERGLLDFLTIDDSLMPQPGRREPISTATAGRPRRRRAGRGPHRAGDAAHRADSGGDGHAHRALSYLQSRCHP